MNSDATDTFTVTVKQTIAVVYSAAMDDTTATHPVQAALDAASMWLQGNDNFGADIQWTWRGLDYRLTCSESNG